MGTKFILAYEIHILRQFCQLDKFHRIDYHACIAYHRSAQPVFVRTDLGLEYESNRRHWLERLRQR
jgi:hypothetical protein